jgi:tRNA-splicing ligase RtcB
MQVIHEEGSLPIKHWTEGVEFQDHAKAQLRNLAKMSGLFKAVCVMPDVHAGRGSTVGSVFATKSIVIPSAVGGDIGCGMSAVKTSLTANDLPESLRELRLAIEYAVPVGRTDNGGRNDRGSWGDPPDFVREAWGELETDYRKIVDQNGRVSHPRVVHQLASMGSGNHFLEICLDKEGCVWIMLHSGSRGIGNSIGTYFGDLAKKDMERYFIDLPDMNLAFIPDGAPHFKPYIEAMEWAQKYAKVNRDLMMASSIRAIAKTKLLPKFTADLVVVDCFHNFTARENHFHENVWITRKGAVRARKNDLCILPGSMGTRSFIVQGKGNPESFTSCSHGAGRRMSRTEAKNTFTVKDHEKATEGVECRKDKDMIDETPGAYKDVDAVLAAEAELITPLYELKQILCIKG